MAAGAFGAAVGKVAGQSTGEAMYVTEDGKSFYLILSDTFDKPDLVKLQSGKWMDRASANLRGLEYDPDSLQILNEDALIPYSVMPRGFKIPFSKLTAGLDLNSWLLGGFVPPGFWEGIEEKGWVSSLAQVFAGPAGAWAGQLLDVAAGYASGDGKGANALRRASERSLPGRFVGFTDRLLSHPIEDADAPLAPEPGDDGYQLDDNGQNWWTTLPEPTKGGMQSLLSAVFAFAPEFLGGLPYRWSLKGFMEATGDEDTMRTASGRKVTEGESALRRAASVAGLPSAERYIKMDNAQRRRSFVENREAIGQGLVDAYAKAYLNRQYNSAQKVHTELLRFVNEGVIDASLIERAAMKVAKQGEIDQETLSLLMMVSGGAGGGSALMLVNALRKGYFPSISVGNDWSLVSRQTLELMQEHETASESEPDSHKLRLRRLKGATH